LDFGAENGNQFIQHPTLSNSGDKPAMRIPERIVNYTNRVLSPFDVRVLPGQHFRSLMGEAGGIGSYGPQRLPVSAEHHLRSDHPRLTELHARYMTFKRTVAGDSQWNNKYVTSDIDLKRFRADNAYVYQFRDWNTAATFALTAYFIETIDRFGLLRSLKEDGLFGPHVFDFNGEFLISRDLMDSIVEIYFLESIFNISEHSNFTILDIGAGYGRMAHRLTTAFPGCVKIMLTDAIAVSTFLSEFYMEFRGCARDTSVIPLDHVQSELQGRDIDLVTNIHSFSECPIAWVTWWLDLIRKHNVRNILIAPNPQGLTTREADGTRIDYVPELKKRGYRLKLTRAKYEAPIVQRYGVSPTTYFLFEAAF
jgi:hypothetical protein